MKIKDGFVLREICGEKIISGEGLNQVNFSKFIRLNDSAAFLLKKVEHEEFTAETLAKLLCEEYEISEEIAAKDAEALCKKSGRSRNSRRIMSEVKHFRTGGLHFSVELDAPWHFMEYTAPVAERIRKAAAGEVLDLLPTRAGDEIPARTLVKSRSELPENFNAHTLDFSQYEPFAIEPSDEEMLRLKIAGDTPDWAADISDTELIMDVSNIDPGYKIYKRGNDTIFEFLKTDGVRSGFMRVPEDCRICEFTAEAGTRPYAAISLTDFALRIACTYISSRYGALMIHSSVVSIDGKANLFLGASGTGKKHAQLALAGQHSGGGTGQ